MKDFSKKIFSKIEKLSSNVRSNEKLRTGLSKAGPLTEKLKSKLKSKTGSSNFNWDQLIDKIYSTSQKDLINTIFTVSLVSTIAFGTAKVSSSFLEIKETTKKNRRSTPTPTVRYTSELNAIGTNNIFNARIDDSIIPVRLTPNKKVSCEKSDRKSRLPIKVLYTTVMHDSKKSLASVTLKGRKKIQSFYEGDDLKGLAKLTKIGRQRIILQNKSSGECEYIGMTDKQSLPNKILTPQAGKKLISSTRPNSIKQQGNNFKIEKKYRDKMLGDIGTILTQAKAIQIKNPDGSMSFKMEQIAPGSIYSHLNIQNGDTIKSINGEPIKDLNKLMMMFGNIKNIDNVSFTLERNGEDEQMNYSFE